jgi:hemoglobin
MAQSIFHRYGGFSKVSRVVSSFYDRVLDSPVTAPYFADIDMKRLIDHQTKFIASLMGGPASYTQEHVERIHGPLGITEEAFYETLELLKETLEDFDFAHEDISKVAGEMMSFRTFVVSKA